MGTREKLKALLRKIERSPLTVPCYYMLEGYYALRSRTLGRPRVSAEDRRNVEESLTFMYKSFNRQRMARRLLRSIRSCYPNARVIIADDSEVPLEAVGAEVVRLPFNSGLSRGLAEALGRVETPYVMRLDDDMLLTARSRVHDHLAFLQRHPEVDLCGLQVNRVLQSSAKVYGSVRMGRRLAIPAGTVIEGREVVYKAANCFVARTESVRRVGYDPNIRMIDHHEFFWRAAGRIVCVQDPKSYVYHCHNWFDWRYRTYREDTAGDEAYIRAKHARARMVDSDGSAPGAAAPAASGQGAGRGPFWDVVHLVRCAVDGVAPDAGRVAAMDLDAVYAEASRHMLASACDAALGSAGVTHAAFREARGRAIRKVSLMDFERGRLFSLLDAAGIWHAPLKGCVLQRMYPSVGMREMSDNDILFDASRADEARGAMESLGFATVSFGSGEADVYHKEPVCNFELHRELFDVSRERRLHEYYRDPHRLLVADGGDTSGMHLRDEDFYVYMVAHEWKHYSVRGTGLRSLVDTYVFLRARSDALDWGYVGSELVKLGIADFERRNRRLSMRLLGGEEIDPEDEGMLAYIAESGTYGTVAHRVANGMRRGGRLGYVLRRACPPYEVMAHRHSVLRRVPVLLPAFWAAHVAGSLRNRRGAVLAELGEALRFGSE